MFRYRLQGSHVSVGVLSTAQIDRVANLNTTLIETCHLRCACRVVQWCPGNDEKRSAGFITVKHSLQTYVKDVYFITTIGFGCDGKARDKLQNIGKGPTLVITDLCILEPDLHSKELIVVSLHPQVTREQVVAATGWEVSFAFDLALTPAPSKSELSVLRDFKVRTAKHHEAQ